MQRWEDIDTLRHTAVNMQNGKDHNDQIHMILTRVANIAMGIAWHNKMDFLQARYYTSYCITVMMIFLEMRPEHQPMVIRYIVDGVVNIYYLSNGELRVRPTIYAERIFRNT